VVRLLIKKTLISSGIVEKLYIGKKDVRYLLTAYRFQETRKVQSSSGQVIRKPVGAVIEIPREHFPIPLEVLQLLMCKTSLDCVLNRIDEDFGRGKISETLYQTMRTEYKGLMEDVCERLKEHNELVKLLGLDH
ncbi:hypothetical protein KAS24_06150, partial [Candidatus Bathyarchaeota archaeon]|nr:hypothetical protein [Candidatus Bathyarchaeota archaeon]